MLLAAQENQLVDLEYASAMRALVTYMMEDMRSVNDAIDLRASLKEDYRFTCEDRRFRGGSPTRIRLPEKRMLQFPCVIAFVFLIFSPLIQAENLVEPISDCVSVNYAAPQEVSPPLYVDGSFFKDASGRTVLLRGVNATGDAKVPPFQTLTRPELLDPLPPLGINILRLLFIWEAFEPNRCHYEQAYLHYYEQVVQWAQERGLYVIVDFHQDAFSRYSVDGCGEGFPKWAVASEIGFSTPDNSSDCATWGYKMTFYLSHHETWSDFHQDKEGARSRYVEMVKYVSDHMAKHRNVIGYDIINEPWGTKEELLSLVNSVGTAIRSRHPSAILFVPAHTLIGSGFISNNMPRPAFNNMVYSPHFYDGAVTALKRWFGNSPDRWLSQIKTKSDVWQVPMLLGEFGAPGTAQNASAYMEAIYQWLDAEFVSGTQWNYTPGWTEKNKDGWNAEDFSIVDNHGQLRRAIFEPRPYPQKTAGRPVSFKRTDHGFNYSWNQDPARGTTEIFIPEHYAENKTLRISAAPGIGANCHLQSQFLMCNSALAGNVNVTLEAQKSAEIVRK